MTSTEFYTKLNQSEYGKQYLQLVQKPSVEEGQVHHIQPKALGGGNEPENLVRLSVRDHVEAHYLLALAIQVPETFSAIYAMSNFQLKGLTELEQTSFQEREEWAKLREQGQQRALKAFLSDTSLEKARDTKRKKYGGDCAGQLHTEKVKKVARTHSKQTRIERYGGPTMHLTSEPVKQKRQKTLTEKYGSVTALMNTPEARSKAYSKIANRFGKVMGQCLTPEVKAKAQKTRNRMKFVTTTEEFLEWYDPFKFRTKYLAVKTFLKETGHRIEEYPEIS